jgi:glutathionyl-hydroquinone reductase
VTVPVLWDRERETIVSNESSEIIRMFNSAFDGLTGNRDDYWPVALRDGIEAVNARVYEKVNNGVYRAGFATTQDAYDEAVVALFETLDWLEDRLAREPLPDGRPDHRGGLAAGDDALPVRPGLSPALQVQPAAADRLPEPLGLCARALPVAGRGRDGELRPHRAALSLQPRHRINPHRIVPINPVLDWTAPHGREALPRKAA